MKGPIYGNLIFKRSKLFCRVLIKYNFLKSIKIMVNKESILKQDKVELKNVIRIFIKRKWWFISSTIFILILELAYTVFNHRHYLLIYNIAASIVFSIITGVLIVIAADFFLSHKTSRES